jgi:quinol-cytochrome oxidoreductase complex cytochrome b subunit
MAKPKACSLKTLQRTREPPTSRYPLKYALIAPSTAHPYLFEDFTMSAPTGHATDNHAAEKDGVEAIVPLMPIVLPLVGAVMMLLIAFIAVFMA